MKIELNILIKFMKQNNQNFPKLLVNESELLIKGLVDEAIEEYQF